MKFKAKQGALEDLMSLLMPSMLDGLDRKDKKKKPEIKADKPEVPDEPLESQELMDEPIAPKGRSISLTQLSLATKPRQRSEQGRKRRPLGKDRG